jgi:cobalt transport protein ATP-binding subunit
MIEILGVSYRYPEGSHALRDVSLTIPDGEFLLLCGPNGSGKTTLIRLINGLIRPSSGRILVDGLDTARANGEVLRRVGMVFQDADSQIVGETVAEDVAFGPENLGLTPAEVEERVTASLRQVNIENLAEKPCHLLSGGEKRRVAIAGVLALRPSVLIFDEPFANLDYAGVRQVLEQIVKLHEEGHTILLTTHDVEKVIAHVERIAILHHGEIKAAAAPESILPFLPHYDIRPPCHVLLGEKAPSWLAG